MFKLLVIGSSYPHSAHSVRAANVVIFQMLIALASDGRGRVGYQLVSRGSDPKPTETEINGLKELEKKGVEVLPPIRLESVKIKRSSFLKIVKSLRSDFYPESIDGELVYSSILNFSADMILVPWSEWLTALCADFPIKKFAYYGNPDHKSRAYRIKFEQKYNIAPNSKLRSFITLKLLEKRHLEVMFKYNIIGNVAQNDAEYYRKKGHQNSFYLQNLWVDRFGSEWKKMRDMAENDNRPIKIVANIGQLGGTANRYGLELLTLFVSVLKKKMDPIKYELNIYGAGELVPTIKAMLQGPEIRFRGFVEDIDSEILASQVFLCLNNASLFKVGHTRYLHAWSLGSFIVAHKDVILSMPELNNNINCMLGQDLDDMANIIKTAVEDKNLRRNIGAAGYETFKRDFSPNMVALKIWDSIFASSRPV
jgi:glycosyltransferase involved in cell wall biosynthesis